jgi:succinate-semialdehyde dehydrogenase/glutarate-semialdehyde dehydrogenase
MKYQSINPYSGQLIKEFSPDVFPDINKSLIAFGIWRKLGIEERGRQLGKLAEVLQDRKQEYAQMITSEMGKPYRESLDEISKVLSAFEYYIENAPAILQQKMIATGASKSYISFEPLGIIFSIMPWNFPFWQVFRFAVPSLIAGNVTILKHAPSVSLCAQAIEDAFKEAGIIDAVFRKVFISNEDAALLIAHPDISGISFTGSDSTGSVLASLAGKYIKKSVIELGGNDAFIVLEDADIEMAVAAAVKSRSINCGQSCNAAKRFIVTAKVYDSFRDKLVKQVLALKVGDPMRADTQIGPLARRDLVDKVNNQVADTIATGAVPHFNPFKISAESNFTAPVVLENVTPGMRAFEEEIFGPVWSLVRAADVQEAIKLANQSQYGLGASIWTNDIPAAEKLVPDLQVGNVFINEIVRSDAKLPFGGIKRSGFGRELSEFGLREFVNIKTVLIH